MSTRFPTSEIEQRLDELLLVGAVAGFVPAIKAARLSPTEALWSV